jgi:hypothetical protein
MKDLDIQTLRANLLAEVLSDFIDIEEHMIDGEPEYVGEITAMALLDALGCCGLVLEIGNDAGMAFMDTLAQRVSKK